MEWLELLIDMICDQMCGTESMIMSNSSAVFSFFILPCLAVSTDDGTESRMDKNATGKC